MTVKSLPNWNPRMGDSFMSKNSDIVNERVSFIPDVSIDCTPPIVAGVPDGCWVKYRKGMRPKTQYDWECCVHIRLQTML